MVFKSIIAGFLVVVFCGSVVSADTPGYQKVAWQSLGLDSGGTIQDIEICSVPVLTYSKTLNKGTPPTPRAF